MYSTLSPCLLCAKEMINAGVMEIYYSETDKSDEESLRLLAQHLRKVEHLI